MTHAERQKLLNRLAESVEKIKHWMEVRNQTISMIKFWTKEYGKIQDLLAADEKD
jgi:hypothetical protein